MRRVLILAVAAAVLFGITVAQTGKSDKDSALRLLDRAVQLAQTFGTWERADALLEAAEIAVRIDPARANAWSKQIFDLAGQMPLGQNRAAMQKNALRTLAITDSDTALKLYRKQDLPSQWLKPDEMVEDPRALSSPSIFDVVWKQKGNAYLDELQKLAGYLGRTGQYPYRPMGDIALDVAKTDPRRAPGILAEATRFFRNDPGFSTTNSQFVEFVLHTRSVASPMVLKSEVVAAVRGLENPHSRAFPHAKFRMTAITPLGTAQFDSESEYLLFRLLPLVKAVDARLAARLLGTHPALQHAPKINVDTPMQPAGVVSPTGKASDERMLLALDRDRVFRVSQLADEEPAQALQVAEQVTDATLRSIALVLLAPAYSGLDAQKANGWLDAANKSLASMPNNVTKLQLLTELIKADTRMQRPEAARSLLAVTFSLGESVYNEDLRQHPEKSAYEVDGFDALNELAITAVKVEGVTTVVTRISAIANPVLRAHLFISAAREAAGIEVRPYLPVGYKIRRSQAVSKLT